MSVIAQWEHGTNGYWHHDCRCRRCTGAAVAWQGDLRAQRNGLPDGDARHGTRNGYQNWRCRCEPCGEANTAYQQALRARKATS